MMLTQAIEDPLPIKQQNNTKNQPFINEQSKDSMHKVAQMFLLLLCEKDRKTLTSIHIH